MKARLFLSLLPVLFISCSPQDICNENNDSELVVRFKMAQVDPVSDTLIPGVTLFGLREGKADSLLYDSMTVSRVVLPLDPHHDFSRFVLNVDNLWDTILVDHSVEAYLLSYTCGFAALFTVKATDHTGEMITDMEIINAVVDADLEQDEEHLWIYF